MEIYEILKKDHQEVKDLFEQIENSLKEKNYDEAESAFEELRVKITAHAKAEQEVFYQPLKMVSEDSKSEDLIGEAEQEHHLIALLLNELSRMDPDAEEWKAKMTVLNEMVNHHFEEEEGEIFSVAQECFSAQDAEEIAENMQDLKQKYTETIDSALAEDIALFNQPLKHPSMSTQSIGE
ncbi:MAG: hemerythrin domain-containing protein [Pseudobdellovibrionaceae bacterium]